MKKVQLAFLLLFTGLISFTSCKKEETNPDGTETSGSYPYQLLSSYQLFKGNMADLSPADGVLPYDLITPLFTDYAKKARFIFIPEGEKIQYKDKEVLEFPQGTILVKNFYYDNDYRDASKGRRIIETRLLIRTEAGWEAFPYIWNAEQTEAELKVIGGQESVQWVHTDGSTKNITYLVPDKQQCNRCHSIGSLFTPIGPKARNLNRDFNYADGTQNQLLKMKDLGWLEGMPDINSIGKFADWKDTSQDLDARARAYLDVNCVHCHSANGRANNSGLFLDIDETNESILGFCKTPVAAGKASGGLRHVISPTEPDKSILVFRMESTETGILMPELGRGLVHKEGVELIREWITKMDASKKCAQ